MFAAKMRPLHLKGHGTDDGPRGRADRESVVRPAPSCYLHSNCKAQRNVLWRNPCQAQHFRAKPVAPSEGDDRAEADNFPEGWAECLLSRHSGDIRRVPQVLDTFGIEAKAVTVDRANLSAPVDSCDAIDNCNPSAR